MSKLIKLVNLTACHELLCYLSACATVGMVGEVLDRTAENMVAATAAVAESARCDGAAGAAEP